MKEQEEDNEGQLDVLYTFLVQCGAESKIIPDTESLIAMESGLRQRLEERSELLDMLRR